MLQVYLQAQVIAAVCYWWCLVSLVKQVIVFYLKAVKQLRSKMANVGDASSSEGRCQEFRMVPWKDAKSSWWKDSDVQGRPPMGSVPPALED